MSAQDRSSPRHSADHRMLQRILAHTRFRQWYGRGLRGGEYACMCDLLWAHVEGSGAAGVIRVPGNVGRYFFTVDGQHYICAWDRETGQIATFFPLASPLAEEP